MQLNDLFDYKNQLMKDLLTNERIISLVKDGTTLDNASDLAYTHIFPFEYIPDTVQKGQTFICFDVDVTKMENKTFLDPVIYIWVLTHQSNIRLPGGGVRTDAICNAICETINGSRYYGLGELDFYSLRRFAPVTEYLGKQMTFYTREFNRQYSPTRPIPINRKG